MEIKPGKFVVLTYDLYAGAGEPEETLMMRATDEMPTIRVRSGPKYSSFHVKTARRIKTRRQIRFCTFL